MVECKNDSIRKRGNYIKIIIYYNFYIKGVIDIIYIYMRVCKEAVLTFSTFSTFSTNWLTSSV